MEKIKVTSGVYWLDIPEADLRVLCGCPANSVKHLMKRGLIVPREKNGVRFETGPNAILLSDVSVQNGSFCNLSEFPALQMLYLQGMILPNHPNNTGVKPMLIGTRAQVQAQAGYIYRGNYGLDTEQELMETGLPQNRARAIMRMKKRFAFDNIRKTEDLLDMRVIEGRAQEIRNGVTVRRLEPNIYEFAHNGETVSVNLNLEEGEYYTPPYSLDFHNVKREYFSVIHSGEGDGWDVNRPCMASIITFQGRLYLIDAGPDIDYSLRALGISVNEIEGIFHTHAHDDHFAGLTTLVRADHRIKYYAAPFVRASVTKKLCSLMGFAPDRFAMCFDIHDLRLDDWNNIDGLEVKPVLSPHPVDTTIMFFRTLWVDGYKSYAHFADTVSFDTLEKMVTGDPEKSGVSPESFDEIRTIYHTPVSIKKIDIGGGLIHGNAVDFQNDNSGRIVLCHTARPLTDQEKEIGNNATFGMQEVLIPSTQDYDMQIAFHNLLAYFPDAPAHELNMFLNCPVECINMGTIIIPRGAEIEHIYLLLNGEVEYIESDRGLRSVMTMGTLVGELSALRETPSRGTFRTASYVKALRLPVEFYLEFVKRNNLYDSILRIQDYRVFLKTSRLFGEMVSYPTQAMLARAVTPVELRAGDAVKAGGAPALSMVARGALDILLDGQPVERAGRGAFFGEEPVLTGKAGVLNARAAEDTLLYRIPAGLLHPIPIVHWKLLEAYERRLLGPHYAG